MPCYQLKIVSNCIILYVERLIEALTKMISTEVDSLPEIGDTSSRLFLFTKYRVVTLKGF